MLSETRLEYAEAAGLVQEKQSEHSEQEEETPALRAREPGRDQSFTAEVVAVSAGEYTREAQGPLKGPHGTTIGFVAPGDNDNPLSGQQGQTLQLETITLRAKTVSLRP